MDKDNIISQLENEIIILQKQNKDLEERLKKYTAPSRSKTYYENHKEELLEKMKKYKPTPEQIKEKNKKAYLKRKEKFTCEHNKIIQLCRICDGSDLCISGLCDTMKNPKYDNYCLRCFIHLFPDKPNTRNYKTKEKSVVEFITNIFNDFSWVSDKKVYDGCSKRRPDLFLDLGFQIIIIEIDENQHANYDCSCENKRIMEISQDVGHRPIVFIRFNPDEYVNENNEIVKSCWKVNNKEIIQIQKNQIEEWNNRLENLKNQIEYWCKEENKTNKTIEIIQLYFDKNNIEY
jgi:hypothetical protein